MSLEAFKRLHSKTKQAFTRCRTLTFSVTLLMVMRNSVKSLQNVANEAMLALGEIPVTASAYCQARYKLKHTAFMALNKSAVQRAMYEGGEYQKFWGFRLLAIDGSKIRLPDKKAISDEFGVMRWKKKGKDVEIEGEIPTATASVLYDVLNSVAIDAILTKAKAYEVDLAVEHLAHTTAEDLLIEDRGYASYEMLAQATHANRQIVIRCSGASFSVARKMHKGVGQNSQIATLVPCKNQRAEMEKLGLPMSLKVRFVRVLLETGENEVLVTSLLDETKYPTEEFKTLYWYRWGIETFYGVLKTRLEIENFTGNSVEAVRQDFFSAIFLTGLESILTDAAQTKLDAKQHNKHRQIVNRSVSFNVIKTKAFDLLASKMATEPLLEQLTALFMTSPNLERKGRVCDRKKTSASQKLDFYKRRKKHCF
jgi:hypothetical protein